ncbi:MAG: hypothetical protein K9K21_12045 [Desulfotignum sp.]|nr:hypothetical protein [Desulfotignum sp.]MCF8114571.1 hypothetical protein [Desulfotignum sp.]
MKDQVIQIPVSDIVLDESIYPRENMDHKRIGIFVENLRDGFEFDPVLVQAFENPELSESSSTARRAFQSNPGLTSAEIGMAIGRSRQAVDLYIADLRATTLQELDLKIFRLHQLGIPQDRIAKRLDINRRTLSHHLAKMPELAKWPNSDLSKGFTVPQVAQKHCWPEPMVWSQALKGMDDRPDTRPEIEPYHWNPDGIWEDLPVMKSKDKPDLIICDPPYFDKKADEYAEKKDPWVCQPVCDDFKIKRINDKGEIISTHGTKALKALKSKLDILFENDK